MMILSAFILSFFEFASVVLMLLAMIVLLLGINRLFHRDLEIGDDETRKFRRELKDSDEVITPHSVFHDFITRERTSSHGDKRLERKPVRSYDAEFKYKK